MFKVVQSDKLPAVGGPYSHALISGNMLFASGQIPMNPETGKLGEGDIKTQTTQVMKNISAILEAAGIGFENVIKTTCYLSNMDDFATFNEIYSQYFTGKPARSCIAAKLIKDIACEVDFIAILQ